MRIALMPSAFAPHVGGVEVLSDRLARDLLHAGHHVEVWTARSPDDALADNEWIDGLRVRRFLFDAPRASPSAAVWWPVRATKTLRRMRSALRESRPDLLHVQCFGINGVYAAGWLSTGLSVLGGGLVVGVLAQRAHRRSAALLSR